MCLLPSPGGRSPASLSAESLSESSAISSDRSSAHNIAMVSLSVEERGKDERKERAHWEGRAEEVGLGRGEEAGFGRVVEVWRAAQLEVLRGLCRKVRV